MPRLFTGIEIPENCRMALSLIRGGLPGARWIDPEHYHLTLRFIGDIDRHTAQEVSTALERIERNEFTLKLQGVGAFGGNKPHSLWAGVAPSEALYALQADIERLFQRMGLPADRRKFQPHVTLARLRRVSAADVAHYLNMFGHFQAPPIRVEHFTLFSAREFEGGGPYLAEETYPLGMAEDDYNNIQDEYQSWSTV